MTGDARDIANTLVHLGRGPADDGRPANLPIHQGSTVLFNSLAEFERAREGRYQHGTLYYGRYGNYPERKYA